LIDVEFNTVFCRGKIDSHLGHSNCVYWTYYNNLTENKTVCSKATNQATEQRPFIPPIQWGKFSHRHSY